MEVKIVIASIKKSIAVVVITSMVLMPMATMMTTDSASAVSKGAVNKMAKKSKNGFKKFKGKWYYIKSKKAVKGLKKISGKYYFFNKIGTMQTGAKKISGKNYYFKAVKSGKKKGQAPALTNNVLTKSGKTWFYNSKGVRYEFAYKNVGNEKGNIAVGRVLSEAKVKTEKTKEARLKKAYGYIVNKYSYMSRPTPKNFKTAAWTYQCAYDMAMGMNRMGKQPEGKYAGKCYNFAALTGLTAKALGYDTTIVPGTCQRPDSDKATEHAWAEISEDEYVFVLDTMWDNNGKRAGKGIYNFFKVQITKQSDGSFYVGEYFYLP